MYALLVAEAISREAAALSHTLFGATDLRSLTLRALSDGLDEQMKEGAAASSTVVTPKFSPVAAAAPAPASFAAVVAAPAPAREHKSS